MRSYFWQGYSEFEWKYWIEYIIHIMTFILLLKWVSKICLRWISKHVEKYDLFMERNTVCLTNKWYRIIKKWISCLSWYLSWDEFLWSVDFFLEKQKKWIQYDYFRSVCIQTSSKDHAKGSGKTLAWSTIYLDIVWTTKNLHLYLATLYVSVGYEVHITLIRELV